MTDDSSPAITKLRALVLEHARAERHVPTELAEKILQHEYAVQFDEKRFDAPSYIKGLIAERLDEEEGARKVDN